MFVLYCKSYRNDVLRVKRLLASVQRFNRDKIPFYISSPESDRKIFIDTLGSDGYIWVPDESICAANPRTDWTLLASMPGGWSQQIIKSEFWRLGLCEDYICLDSDSEFLRNFYLSDFIHLDGNPFTVMHDNIEFLTEATKNRKIKIVDNFNRESQEFKKIFSRVGEDYDFGPSPYIWSSKVWRAIDNEVFSPKGLSIWSALLENPYEARWYGEGFIYTKAIPIHPIGPLFKVFHYHWQWVNFINSKSKIEDLAKNYLGVIRQSNWELEFDARTDIRSKLSRFVRRVKRLYHHD